MSAEAGPSSQSDSLPLETTPVSGPRIVAIITIGVVAMLALLSLGAWQIERLGWKQHVLETIAERLQAAPLPLSEASDAFARGEDLDYRPVVVRGTFDHRSERYFLATRDGEAGWHVYTPLQIEDSKAWAFVNRGFVPYDRKLPETRLRGNPTTPVEIAGLIRVPQSERPSFFIPDNDPKQNVFFWRNIADMATGLDLAGEPMLSFFIDAGPGAADGGYPIGGVTVVDMPNNHLQYAITWFSLALALLVMLVLFVRYLLVQRRGTEVG